MEITDHCYKRAKERLGLNKKAFLRHSVKMVEKGINVNKTKSHLKKWITDIVLRQKFKPKVYLYGNAMLITLAEKIITVYDVPQSLLPLSKFTVKD